MATAAAKKITFSEAETKIIHSACLGVWDEIGWDILKATADDKGKDVEAVTISRDVVLEVVLDAGRAEERLKREVRTWPPEVAKEFLDRWEAVDYTQRLAVVRPAFPYSRWGV